MLAAKNRLNLPAPVAVWLQNAIASSATKILPVNFGVALQAGLLPFIHKDPVDRILIAHTVVDAVTLVTEDRAILSYGNDRIVRPQALLN